MRFAPRKAPDTGVQPFSHASYALSRPLFALRRMVRVRAAGGAPCAFVEQPLFRLHAEMVMYADEAGTEPILVIRNRRFAALNMEHDIFEARGGRRLGVLRTQALRSRLRDAWDILDGDEQPVFVIVEEGAYLWRRFFPLRPGRHRIELGGRVVARVQPVFHLVRREFLLELAAQRDPIEPRFAIACALVAMAADLRREQRQ